VHQPGTPSAWSRLDRRARIVALLGLGALALATVATTWFSTRFGQPAMPFTIGGDAAPGILWIWDGAGYSMTPGAGAGPYSNDADMAFDRARGVLVLWDHGCGRLVMGFTGGCVDQVNRTWTWDGRRWSAQRPRSVPAEVGQGAMVYDSRIERVVYVSSAGRAWAWTGSDWLPVATNGAPAVPDRGSAAAASMFAAGYDEGRRLLVLALSTSTWTWDGTSWTEVQGGIDAAGARADAHLVYDREHGQLVYVGSRSTWTWDGVRWRAHDQPAIAAGTLGYDPVRRTVMLVQLDASACDRTWCRTTVWSWDSRSWSRLPVDRVPALSVTRSGAFPPPMAFDEARGVMAFFASAI
jgi:hypothetical protein